MAASTHQARVLCDREEELVRVLSVRDPVELGNDLHKRCLISDGMWELFDDLDHSSVELQLQVRFLLRLVGKKLEEDGTVWDRFLNFLSSLGASC